MKLNIATFALAAGSAAASCSTEISPVCHHDISFQNSCLAKAQGVFNYHDGACSGGVLPPYTEEGPTISPQEMKMFADEGFYFVGRTQNGIKPGPQEDDEREVHKHNGQYVDAEEGEDRRLTRITVAGSMYVTNNFEPSFTGEEHFKGKRSRMLRARKAEEEEEGAGGSDGGTNDARKLSVFLDGSDDRVQIFSPFDEYNDDKVGELLYDRLDAPNPIGGCTATVIGRNKILTAAHCVYNSARGEYHLPTEFAPRRYRTEDRCPSSGPRPRGCEERVVDPYGKWPVVFATIHSAYISPPDIWGWPWDYIPYDVAVINLGPRDGADIGPTVGTMRIREATRDGSCYNLEDQIGPDSFGTIGYPWDKSHGSLWLSDACDSWSQPWCGSNWVFHNCDVTAGMDGGPLYQPDRCPIAGQACSYRGDSPPVFGVQGEPRHASRSTYFDDGFHSNVGYAFDERSAVSVPLWGNVLWIPAWPEWPWFP